MPYASYPLSPAAPNYTPTVPPFFQFPPQLPIQDLITLIQQQNYYSWCTYNSSVTRAQDNKVHNQELCGLLKNLTDVLQQLKPHIPTPTPVHVNVQQITATTQETNATADAKAHTETTTAINNQSVQSMATHIAQSSNQILHNAINHGSHFVTQYTDQLMQLCLCGPVTIFYTWMLISRKNLYSLLLWSSWHGELSNDELQAIPSHKIAYELIHHAHIRCFDPRNPFSYEATIIQLFKQLREEKNHFNLYYKAAKVTQKIKLNYFFLLFPSDIKEIKRRISRLAYLEKSLIAYITDYSLQKASSFLDYMEKKK